MKKIVIIAVLAAVGLLVYSQRATLVERIFERGMASRLGADITADFPDGLHLALCGAGGPLPAPKASGPCVAIVAGSDLFIVDAGTDGLRNLGRMGYPAGNIDALFLTHFHSDHIDGLGEFATIRWVGAANTEPLPVYGPEGVEAVVDGFNAAYAQDVGYRHEHHGDTVAPTSGAGMRAVPFEEPQNGELVTIYDNGSVTVEALKVDHEPVNPAVGYLFRYKDRSILVSGDTAQSDNITRFAKDVDLLVHEALAPNLVGIMNAAAEKMGNKILAKVTIDIPDYHASPVEAAETARDAGVGHLLYYHIVPPLVIPGQEAVWLDGAEEVFPDYTVGQDGTAFSLPAGSTEIIQTSTGL
jgi:ribonuclease Z